MSILEDGIPLCKCGHFEAYHRSIGKAKYGHIRCFCGCREFRLQRIFFGQRAYWVYRIYDQ